MLWPWLKPNLYTIFIVEVGDCLAFVWLCLISKFFCFVLYLQSIGSLLQMLLFIIESPVPALFFKHIFVSAFLFYWKWPRKTFLCCFHLPRYDGRFALPFLCTFYTTAVREGKSSALMREVTLFKREIIYSPQDPCSIFVAQTIHPHNYIYCLSGSIFKCKRNLDFVFLV